MSLQIVSFLTTKQIRVEISIMSFFNFDDNFSSNKDSSFFTDMEDTKAGGKRSSTNEDSSFFVAMEDTGAGEKRSGFDVDAAGGGDGTNSSDVRLKAPTSKKSKVDPSPSSIKRASTQGADGTNFSEVKRKAPNSKKSKVDPSPSPQKRASTQEAPLADTSIKENSKTNKIKDGKNLPSVTLRDSIEDVRSKMLAMIPDIKRQEEAGDSVMARATVLESDLQDYGEKLAEVKHEYTSRLNQISSILSRPH